MSAKDGACSNCKHWSKLKEPEELPRRFKKLRKENMGECRRYAPLPNAFQYAGAVNRLQGATWPTTEGHDYCGEFQLGAMREGEERDR